MISATVHVEAEDIDALHLAMVEAWLQMKKGLGNGSDVIELGSGSLGTDREAAIYTFHTIDDSKIALTTIEEKLDHQLEVMIANGG